MDQNAAVEYRSQKEEDESFLWYVEEHSQTPRALFSGKDINRLLQLVGPIKGMVESVAAEQQQFYALHYEQAHPLVEKARKRLSRPKLTLIIGGKKD